MTDRFRLLRGILTVLCLLVVMGCRGNASSDGAEQKGAAGDDSPVSGTLSLDNAQEIGSQATGFALGAVSLHQAVRAYQGLLPWSEILRVVCAEGEVDLTRSVPSPVTDFQGDEFFGSRYDYKNCVKPEGERFQGKIGYYWDPESTIYVVEMENFSASDSYTETPLFSSGLFVLSVNEDSGFDSELVMSLRKNASGEPIHELDAAFSYQRVGLETLQWRGHFTSEGYGTFELLIEDGESPQNIISDGENLLYLDFSSIDGDIIEASIDLGADGALDAIWPMNLNDLEADSAGLVLLNKSVSEVQ